MRKLCRRKSILIFLAVLLVLSLFPFDQIRADELSDSGQQTIERGIPVGEESDTTDDDQKPDNDKKPDDEDGNEGEDNLPDEGQNEEDDLEPGAGGDEEGDPDTGKEEQPGGEEQAKCELTDGCTLLAGHEGACVLRAVDPADKEEQPSEDEQEKCELTDGCMLPAGHEGDCIIEDPCDLTEGCTLLKGHEGDCIVEDMEIEEIGVQKLEEGTITIKPLEDKISAYFGEELKAKVSVSCPMNAKNFFFLKMDTDRAGLVSVEGTEELNWTETEGGYYFTLDNENEDAEAEFVLTFKSDENATSESSNPAKVLIYAGNGADQDEAEEAAETAYKEQNEELEFTWSASSDKLQYSIDLYWKTADESQKYEQSIDTVKTTEIDITYVLNIITSSGTYPTGSMEVRIPYALWKYRSGYACIPSQISIPMKPDIPADEDIRYHYYVDDKGTSDRMDDELVVTNWCEVSAGTDTTIEVRYTVNPGSTIDMSKAELVAKGTATTTLQEKAETHESNAITFQLDTGIVSPVPKWGDSAYSFFYDDDEVKVGGETQQLDTEKYRYVEYSIYRPWDNEERNQGMKMTYTFSDELCEEVEVIGVIQGYGSLSSKGGKYSSCMENKWSYNFGTIKSNIIDFNILVRYPAEVVSFKPMITWEAVATDEDSHSEEDGDHNDLISGKLVRDTPIEWKDYDYQIGNLESWSKTGGSTVGGGVELLEAGESIEMKWSVNQSYNGNLLPEETKQKFEIYDDFHFWNMGENGAYIPMTEEDYEITDVSSFSISYSRTNTKNGKVSYPDYEGGTIIIEGYRNGVWEEIGAGQILEAKNRSSSSLSKKYSINSMEGEGYTRIRVITPEFGKGEVEVSFEVTSKIKADSPAVKENAARESKTSYIKVLNWAAFKHFTTDEDGNNYKWDDGNGEYKIHGPYNKSDVFYLEERDKAEQNYGEGDGGSYMLRACSSGTLTSVGGKRSDINKTTKYIVNNSQKQRVDVTFSVYEYEAFSASKDFGNMMTDYLTEFQQTEGVFYDLLPEGYHYNTESEPVAYGFYRNSDSSQGKAIVELEDIIIVDNWDGTGREMVIFKTKLKEGQNNYQYTGVLPFNIFDTSDKGNNNGWYTGFQIQFDTYITWKDLVYTTGKSVNLVAFQSGKTISGSSMSDNGISGTRNDQLVREFSYVTGRDGNSAFYDIDGDGVITDNSTLYAYSEVSIDVATAVEVGIDKRVKGNGGIYTTEDTTSLNDTYKYRVGVTNSASGTLKDLIVYDILEDAANKEGATGEVTWKGTYKDIDLSRAAALGVKPVVYYSTVKGLDYNEKTGDQKDQWLEDTSVWSTTMPADKSKITAVAVDLRKKTDESDFELPNNGCVFFEISMIAPENLPQLEDPDKIYAINRPAYSCYRQTKTSATGEYATVIGTRVKIRIEETSRSVEKKWDDEDNLDKSRPSQVQVQLFADGEPYGEAVTLKKADNWTYTWEHLPKTAIGGTEIVWSVEEMKVPEGYSAEVEETGNKFIITNSHTPVPTPEPTITPSPKPTPGDETPTPEATPGDGTPTPKATPETTPGDETPTPEATPETTPGDGIPTPEATPETTPGNKAPTPAATPEVTPGPDTTPEATPEATPENTSTPQPTPEDQPTPATTPDFWEEVPPEPVEEINPENGINVPETGIHAAVLGVRRATDCAVLGKRRRPETGDSMQLFIWLGILAAAGVASIGAGAYLRREKKKGIKEDE